MTRSCAIALLVGLAACGQASSKPQGDDSMTGARTAPAGPGLDPAAIVGRWRILTLNGAALRSAGRETELTPHLVFSAKTYGGHSGCNGFGGLGLLHGDRYYGGSASQTMIGCEPALTSQENAIKGLIQSAPRTVIGADGVLTLTAGTRSMTLRRAPELGGGGSEWAVGPALLAGTSWRIKFVDGNWFGPGGRDASRDGGRVLTFEADTWSGRAACATQYGGWRQEGDRVVLAGATAQTEQLCAAPDAAIDDALTALMKARPRVAMGPNGELLIAGGGHWIEGERARETAMNDARALLGGWRIAEIDGAPPVAGSRPSLSFGQAGYSGSTGCNTIQGLFLAMNRRVFTAPGPQTQIGCGKLSGQEARIRGLLAGAPRLAFAGDRRMSLIDKAGRLVLVREGSATADPQAPAAREVKVLTGRAIALTLNGIPVQRHYSEPEGWFRLSPGRWEARVGCTTQAGIWRPRGEAVEVFTDPGPDRPPRCAAAAEARDRVVTRLMNGRVRAVLGVNGELLIAGEDHWLVGRIDPVRSRKAGSRRTR